MKELLKGMTVDDDESKQQFRQLMSYFLIEGVLLCGSNSKMPRSSTWWMVKDLEACESVNWAKATEEHLHKSMAYEKAWLANAKLEEGAQAQHGFMGCTPALEAIVYERIPKMRPCTHSRQSPPIQKYTSQRKGAGEWIEGKLSQLAESDIVGCPHCPLAVENTSASLECPASSGSPLAVEKTPASVEDLGRFSDLSLSNVAGTWDAILPTPTVAGTLDATGGADYAAAVVEEAAVKKSRYGRIIRPRKVLSPSR